MQFIQFLQPYLLPALAVTGIFAFSVLVAYRLSKREVGRRYRANDVVLTLHAEIVETKAVFAGKYMPRSVDQALRDALEVVGNLLQRSYTIYRESQYKAIAAEVAAAIKEIQDAVALPFTATDIESDRLALCAALVAAEEEAANWRGEIEAVYEGDMAHCAAKLESDRVRIAESQARLAALAG